MIRLAMGMGNTRNEQLAEYYLKAAGIAAVWIDLDGCVGAQDAPRVHLEAGRVAYCTARGAHFVLAYRLQLWKQEQRMANPPGQAAIAARLEELAAEGRVGITSHQTAVDRALAAVGIVNDKIDAMKDGGEMKAFNRAFKEARKVDPTIRYFDYLHSRKAALLEKLAMEGR
jgi:hypothetical protein